MKQDHFKTKSSMICDLVRKDIVHERLLPGTRLIVSEIAKSYNVSQIPVREAFQILVQTGFLVSVPNSGFVVSSLSIQDIREVFELRISLEELAVSLAAKRMSQENLSDLQHILDQSKSCLDCDDFQAYWKFNRLFHTTLYQFADNQKLLDMILTLYQYSARYPQYFTDHAHLQKSYDEHLFILNACKAKNYDVACVLMRSHNRDTYLRILEQFRAKTKANLDDSAQG